MVIISKNYYLIPFLRATISPLFSVRERTLHSSEVPTATTSASTSDERNDDCEEELEGEEGALGEADEGLLDVAPSACSGGNANMLPGRSVVFESSTVLDSCL